MLIDRVTRRYAAKRRTGTLWAVSLSIVVLTLDITIVNVALPDMLKSLGASVPTAQWIVNAYVLVFASLLMSVGSASDRYGRKWLFTVGHKLFAAASLACALAPNAAVLVVGRGLQGAGGAILFGTCFALIADVFRDRPREERAAAMGFAVTVGAAASAMGPLVGGLIVEVASWRVLFAINVPITMLVLSLAATSLPSDRGRRNHRVIVDPASVLSLTVGLLALNYALINHDTRVLVIGMSAGVAVVALVAFVLRQRQLGDHALVDLAVFRVPSFVSVTYLAFAGRLLGFGMYPFIVLWLSSVVEMSPAWVGVVMLAMAVPMILISRFSAKWISWASAGQLMGLSMAVTAVGLGLGLLISRDAWWTILPMLVVVGLGTGIGMPHMMNIAVDTMPPERAGMATGVANSALPLGTAAGVAVFGAVLHHQIEAINVDSVLSTDDHGHAHEAGHAHGEHGAVEHALELGSGEAIADLPGLSAAQIHQLTEWSHVAITTSLHQMCMVAVVAAAVGAVAGWWGIRDKDRWSQRATPEESESSAA